VVVEDLLDTGEVQTVYNLEVAEAHTYFVGMKEWGFSVWAHNSEYAAGEGENVPKEEEKELPTFEVDWADPAQRPWAENWLEAQKSGRPLEVTWDPEGTIDDMTANDRRKAAQELPRKVKNFKAKRSMNKIGSLDEYPPCGTVECKDPWVGHVSDEAQHNQGGRLRQFTKDFDPGQRFRIRIINIPGM
jgi:hypothetical protein